MIKQSLQQALRLLAAGKSPAMREAIDLFVGTEPDSGAHEGAIRAYHALVAAAIPYSRRSYCVDELVDAALVVDPTTGLYKWGTLTPATTKPLHSDGEA